MPLKLSHFLKNLLALMKEDYHQQLQELIKDARGITCLQTLDTEKAVIQVTGRRIRITSRARKKQINVRVTLSRDCLFKILEGKITLSEAFFANELKVSGEPVTLLRCYAIWERVISLARTSPRLYFLAYKLR
ncbi:MAG: SCP2 sterol-binding domain-containing protein [Thaumarchaeota archaeon]|nr:SCP2 sterol-binding domain-containing protein [Nitrososphaerota archaeon]